LKFR